MDLFNNHLSAESVLEYPGQTKTTRHKLMKKALKRLTTAPAVFSESLGKGDGNHFRNLRTTLKILGGRRCEKVWMEDYIDKIAFGTT